LAGSNRLEDRILDEILRFGGVSHQARGDPQHRGQVLEHLALELTLADGRLGHFWNLEPAPLARYSRTRRLAPPWPPSLVPTGGRSVTTLARSHAAVRGTGPGASTLLARAL